MAFFGSNVDEKFKDALITTANGIDRYGTDKGYHLKPLIKDMTRAYPEMYVYVVCGGTGQVRYFSQYTIDGMYAGGTILGIYHCGAYVPAQFLTHNIADVDKYIKATGQGA